MAFWILITKRTPEFLKGFLTKLFFEGGGGELWRNEQSIGFLWRSGLRSKSRISTGFLSIAKY